METKIHTFKIYQKDGEKYILDNMTLENAVRINGVLIANNEVFTALRQEGDDYVEVRL